jgi:hypothetical protein
VGRLLQPRFQQYRLGPARVLARHLAPRHRLGRKAACQIDLQGPREKFARVVTRIAEGVRTAIIVIGSAASLNFPQSPDVLRLDRDRARAPV